MWELVWANDKDPDHYVEALAVPGGWIYRIYERGDIATVFVPKPAGWEDD